MYLCTHSEFTDMSLFSPLFSKAFAFLLAILDIMHRVPKFPPFLPYIFRCLFLLGPLRCSSWPCTEPHFCVFWSVLYVLPDYPHFVVIQDRNIETQEISVILNLKNFLLVLFDIYKQSQFIWQLTGSKNIEYILVSTTTAQNSETQFLLLANMYRG